MNVLFWGLDDSAIKFLAHKYVVEYLNLSLIELCGRYLGIVKQYEVPLFRMLVDILRLNHTQ